MVARKLHVAAAATATARAEARRGTDEAKAARGEQLETMAKLESALRQCGRGADADAVGREMKRIKELTPAFSRPTAPTPTPPHPNGG